MAQQASDDGPGRSSQSHGGNPDAVKNPNHFFITDEITRTSGFRSKDRYEENIEAYRILQDLELLDRSATVEEKSKLVRFNGWGGLPEVFDHWDSRKNPWSEKAYTELKELLSDPEYHAALDSINNSHYTNPVVIRHMWRGLLKLGFNGGKIIETSLGSGSFFGLAPEQIVRNSVFLGIEKDRVPGRIAKKVYPDARIMVMGYEDASLPDNFFDLAISNVPFGNFSVFDKNYPQWSKHAIHDFFFFKTLEKVKPNGIVAFITSSFTLDKGNEKIRRQIHKKAEFLGAVRLPVNSQRAQAGTDVTTDIIFLKKRTRPLLLSESGREPSFLEASLQEFQNASGNNIAKRVNRYFVEHPEQIAGELFLDQGQYGSYRVGVCETSDEELDLNLARIFDTMFKASEIEEKPLTEEPSPEPNITEDPKSVTYEFSNENPEYNNLGSYLQNPDDPGMIYQIIRKEIRQVREDVFEDVYIAERQDRFQGKTLDRLLGLLKVKKAVSDIFAAEKKHGGQDHLDVSSARKRLNNTYDKFIDEFGPLNLPVNARLFLEDPEYGRVMALEHYDGKKRTAAKADIFEQSVIAKVVPVTRVDNARDGLLVSLNQYGEPRISYIAQLTGKTEDLVIEELNKQEEIFFDPDSYTWKIAAEYLSGDVKKKLKNARAASDIDDQFVLNVRALERVQPKDLMPSDISVRLGAPWVPAEDVRAFAIEQMAIGPYEATDFTIHYRSLDGQWNLGGVTTAMRRKLAAVNDLGTDRRNFFDLLERALNQKKIEVYDTHVENGNEVRVLNRKETVAAQQKLQQIQNRFKNFLWQDNDRAKKLVRIYNDTYNTIVPPKYDGSHLTFPGMSSAIKPRGYQANGVWRGLQTGNILLGHEVGLGKTLELIALAMESKRLGRAHKPLIEVPNYMLEQITRESQQLYPGARILMTTMNDLKKEKRRLFVGKVATNNWDLIVMTHSMFGKIRVDPKFEEQFLANIIDDYQAELMGIDVEDPATRRQYGVKQIQQKIKSLEAKLKRLQENIEKNKDLGVTLDDLGVDMILVDESHNFKNLDIPNAGTEVNTGIQGSQRAWDLHLKSKWLYDKHGKETNLIEATGTPVSNNVFEIFNLQRRLQPELLKERRVNSVNSWAATFLSPKSQWEPSPSGSGFVLRTRYEMVNIPELMQMLRGVMDVVRADDVGIERPEMETVNITAKMNAAQMAYMEHLDTRVKQIRDGLVDKSEDNLLKIVSEGRRLALDPLLLAEHFENVGIDLFEGVEEGHKDKIGLLIENVSRIHHETVDDRATQLIFCDLGTPGSKKPYNVYDRIKQGLVDSNIDSNQVAFIHDFKTDKAKAESFKAVREGEIRELVGSTSKMGEGVNVQDRAIAVHHADPPWRPSDIEQRDGRVKRFGNLFKNIKRYIYTTEDTFDLFMWNLLKVKAETFGKIMAGEASIRKFDLAIDPSYAETAAITSNNELIKEKLEIDQALSELEMLQGAFHDNQLRLNFRKDYCLSHIRQIEASLSDYSRVPDVTADVQVWNVDLKVRGHKQNYKGDREKLLPLLAKIFKTEEVDFIDGIWCGNVPMRVDKKTDPEQKKSYTVWVVCDTDHNPIPSLNFKSTPKVESFLRFIGDETATFKGSIRNLQKEISQIDEALQEAFGRDEELLELKERLRVVEDKINAQETVKEDQAETDPQEESESVMVM